MKFKSGGYAACEAECHPCWLREPPTREACIRCVQVREARPANAGWSPGVHSSVVYFCALAPSAHRGNVMCVQESRAWRSVAAGKSQMGPWRACRNSGDAMCPLSAGCSRRYSDPASRPARRRETLAIVSGRYVWEPCDVIAIADRRRSAVGDVRLVEAADGEGRAGRRSNDSCVCAG
eukprot:2878185-Pleurochrysis_carterae.AAC.4